ncbi:N-acetylmuramoyl-L-alanine amidase [Corynebacterium argentoratense]|uniref:N-acetylmuramoyl-L-alanine amidase n=1 Tax=Corynebacterium argentoratense TaxID=42817 RepID=UPI001F26E5DA|nr:N-acetylmuramoyl-L-alanine amidase [Corynebacterium argentoratense]MCF1694109.1 N-acetylmuramoyl-L-alanine amidase [Corynebacterium argentoratense]MCF1735680.1 N-acetylmuramoyl-L-alanine amidase [Corynebacterium argentoratense]
MTEILRVGDSDPRVAEVRATLARLGQLDGFDGADTQSFSASDTYFDAHLAQALQAFQQSRGIIADGVIGEVTLRALREASYTLGARVLQYQPGKVLVGDDVAELQDQLHELGFYTSRVDGQFGPATHEAVMNYQLNYGLNTDGICGPNTVRALSYLGLRITGGSPNAIREIEQVRRAGPRLTGKRVVLDPGLGGQNKGLTVKGPYGDITEEEILWDIASRIEGRMVAAGVETIMSRPRMDDPTFEDRAEIANAFGADLMICLQCDRYPNDKANGVATFYFGSEKGSNSITGEKLSGFIQREISARTELTNCGNHGRTWDILRLTYMPAIDVVLGYLTNPNDVAILTDPQARDAIAEAIVVAVKRLYLLDDDDQPTGTYKFSELLEQEVL